MSTQSSIDPLIAYTYQAAKSWVLREQRLDTTNIMSLALFLMESLQMVCARGRGAHKKKIVVQTMLLVAQNPRDFNLDLTREESTELVHVITLIVPGTIDALKCASTGLKRRRQCLCF